MTTQERCQKTQLMDIVWQPFIIQGKQYFIKYLINNDSYELLMTDTVCVWYENCDCKSLKKRSKKLNPSVEAPVRRLLEHLQNNVENQQRDCTYAIEEESPDTLVLCITSKLAEGVPFTWKFKCQVADSNMTSSHLVVPLLTMVSELQRRQVHLQKLLNKKDAEIEDYKLNGAKVSRKHLETVPFDESLFQSEMSKSQSFEKEVKEHGRRAFNAMGQDLYQQIMMKRSWLEEKKESGEGKTVVSPEKTASTSEGHSPTRPSPNTSPAKSLSPVKDTELMRRKALEKRLAQEESKLATQKKKTKKGLF